MHRVREALLIAIAAAIVLHVLAGIVAALTPYLVGALVVWCVLGAIYHRRRW